MCLFSFLLFLFTHTPYHVSRLIHFIPFYLVISAFPVSSCSFFFLYSASLPSCFFICSLSHHAFPLPPLSPSARSIPFSLHPLFLVYFFSLVSYLFIYLFSVFRLYFYFSFLCFPVNVRPIQMWVQCLLGPTRR
jgi:hypothetical protein